MKFARPLGAVARQRVALPFAITSLVWGSTWIVITTQLHHVPASWSIGWRFSLGALGMFVVARAMGAPFRLAREGHGLAILVGLTQFVLNYVFVYGAEEQITSGLVALISALLIVPNALFGWLFLRQRLSRPFLIGATIAIAGIALLFADELHRSGSGSGRILIGVALSLGGILSASTANIVLATEKAKRLPPPTLLAWSMAYGALINLAIAILTDWPPRFAFTPVYIVGVLYLALVGSALTFSLYFGLIRHIGPARAGYVGVVTPVIAMALSTLFEGYRWTGGAIAGAALTFAGLFVAMRGRTPAR